MKILISGGHLTPALAFIDYLQTYQKNVEIVFVGREYSRESDRQPSREKQEITARNIEFIPLLAAKLADRSPITLLKQSSRFAASLTGTISIIVKHKPDIFVSFGGYLAVPVALACWVQRIPVITHEQTRSVGISNQIISRLAKKVAISYPESAAYLPDHKTVVTGNLIRKQLLKKNPVKPSWLTSATGLPILYITGGSQGSEVINTTISQVLSRILRDWVVIHQCGTASQTRSYATELQKKKRQLSKTQQSRYYIHEWVNETELAWIYKNASVVVSRAGANTTQELIYNKIPSVLIPLPFSHYQEQQKNAEALAATGGAIIIPQKHLTPETLLEAIASLRAKNQACRRKLSELDIPQHADKNLFKLVTEIVPAAREKKES